MVEPFTARLAERMAALRVGRGTEAGVQVGPMIDAPSRDKVASLVDEAVQGGAEVVVGGRPAEGPGWFYSPTVLRHVSPDAALLEEEIFGPVAPITAFQTLDEALGLANATEYGLVAYAFTRDLDNAVRLAERLDTGMVAINQGVVSNPAAPFGGVKASGFGREGGREGIEEYLETRYVGIRPR
ncbi:aldehyde dehydrogenase family protein [Nocardioides panacis]|uniref:aldehyde dehydrogenase family protein n=1 Tax=Nocardioides panacis TaxID=2849501 RepID=UPI00345E200D